VAVVWAGADAVALEGPVECPQSPGFDRKPLALHGDRTQRVPAAVRTERVPGDAAHDDLARIPDRHQAGGRVDRVSDRSEASPDVGSDVPDDRRTGVDADAEDRPAAMGVRDRLAGRDDREPGRGGAPGVVGLIARGIEHHART